MGIAILSAQRSKDPVTQVGACIVDNENKIVGIGYNCMPKGLDDTFSWTKNKRAPLEHKKSYGTFLLFMIAVLLFFYLICKNLFSVSCGVKCNCK